MNRIKISDVNRKDRNKRYGVRWEENGKPKHKFFQFKAERNGFRQQLEERAKSEGTAIFEITAEQARILKTCIQKLGNIETVFQAVLEYEKRHCPNPTSLSAAIKEHLDEGYNLGRDDNWMRAGRVILQRFEFAHDENVNSITQEDASRAGTLPGRCGLFRSEWLRRSQIFSMRPDRH